MRGRSLPWVFWDQDRAKEIAQVVCRDRAPTCLRMEPRMGGRLGVGAEWCREKGDVGN